LEYKTLGTQERNIGQHVREQIRDVVAECAKFRYVRDDVPAYELAAYCVHALAAAGSASSQAALHRLVAVTLAGLGPRS
jgi:hypothetical protein